MEFVYVHISHPSDMDKHEILTRVKKLVPCRTGKWVDEDNCVDWMNGDLEIETGFYDKNPAVTYGPDETGVKVTWESNDFTDED